MQQSVRSQRRASAKAWGGGALCRLPCAFGGVLSSSWLHTFKTLSSRRRRRDINSLQSIGRRESWTSSDEPNTVWNGNPLMAKPQTSKPQVKTRPLRNERRGAKPPPPRSSGGKRWLLAPLLLIAGWWAWAPGEETLRERHAGVLSKAEALHLPVNKSSEELEALERVGPLLDSVGLELGGMDELTGKIQIILRGVELLHNDTLHLKPGLEDFRGAWDAITSTWGGAARVLPAEAAVALAAVETSFRTARSPLSSASGLWQLVNPKPPGGTQERFEKPANYWQQQYNECFDKLGGIGNLELRKHTAG